MNKKFITCVFCAVVFALSITLIDNKSEIDFSGSFSVENARDTAKKIIIPLAYKSGLIHEPKQVKRSDFFDRPRFFTKSINDDGRVLMSEVHGDKFKKYFEDSDGVLVDGAEDLIVSRFDGVTTERRIVFDRGNAEFPINLLRMISSLVKHGGLDNANKYQDSLEALRTRSLSMTCNTVSDFSREMLEDIGVKSRIVTTLTLDEWNSYDNGHTFLEVFTPYSNSWVAIDMDANVFFSTPTVEHASVLDMVLTDVDHISFPPYVRIASIDYSTFTQYQVISDFAFLNKKEWYLRVLQALALKDEATGKYVFATDDEKKAKRIKSYSPEYTTMSVKDFSERFYGADNP